MSSNMRIAGLASGMDIESIVKQLMTAARIPVNKLYQEKTLLQWKKDDYRAMNTQLSKLRDALSNLRLQRTFLTRRAISTNEAAVEATAGNNAATSTYQIHVEQIATTTTNISGEVKIDPDKKLWDYIEKQNEAIKNKFDQLRIRERFYDRIEVTSTQSKLKLTHGESITEAPEKIVVRTKDEDGNEVIKTYYKQEGSTGEELIYSLEGSEGTEEQIILNINTGELIFSEDNPVTEGSIIEADYEYKSKKIKSYFTIMGEDGKPIAHEITIDTGSESLNSLFRRISSNRELGISLFYDSFKNVAALSTTRTGIYNEDGPEVIFGYYADDENGVLVEDFFFKEILNFSEANEKKGKNAIYTINGLSTESRTNQVTINGTTFTLKGEGNATVSVTSDTEAVLETIKNFVETYNEIIDTISAKIREERYRDYPPLTKEQKEEMDENEIKLWEERAKSGLLRSDPLLRSVLDKMRFAWSTPVAGSEEERYQMAEFGITTGSYLEYGKLKLDEDKLREVLNEDPEAVLKFFTLSSENDSTKGVAQRLYGIVNEAISQLSQKAGNPANPALYDNSELAESIRNIEDRIKERERRLQIQEQRYWTQFTLMEKYIQRANMQSMWLMQQFMS